ncbi:MAG: helix-turn-helix domain-containing protein [Opitutaceae bacterium]|nr:helix-turn-helix domain-containing protein [Opitutaceae bacterium]
MVTNKLKELEAARAKLANLEQSIADEMKKELAALPAQYGFASVAEFISAVKAATAGRRGRKPGAKNRRRRAVITDDMRLQVKKLLEAGKSGAEIARTVKISVPSVHNIKKSLGLVKAK